MIIPIVCGKPSDSGAGVGVVFRFANPNDRDLFRKEKLTFFGTLAGAPVKGMIYSGEDRWRIYCTPGFPIDLHQGKYYVLDVQYAEVA